MHLKILLPYKVFAEINDVRRIVVQTSEGSMGLLPHRRDCTAALAPGILVWQTGDPNEVYTAVDEGVLVKTGDDVLVSVRNAIGGADLGKLHEAVEKEFLNLNDQEQQVRHALTKLEMGLVRQMAEFHHG
jgi:F-type H+-transporting ATPase subunit epsilon